MVATSPIITQTKLSMISAALIMCGEKPVSSINDTRYGAVVAAGLYDMIYENELTSGSYRFACTKATLAQVNTTPINEWQYVFLIPPDSLKVIGFWGISPDRAYDIYGNKIYTNFSSNPGVLGGTLTLEYMFKPDESTLPSYFTLLATLALAKHFVKPVTESDSSRTKIEQAYNLQRNIAQFTDASQRPNRQLQSRPFITVR